ncbi:S66 peptidase family protein [Streptomyces canus]|uniref:S66 peptidase family protein n=1 Tax=Streptomyces sp. SAI-144 TaxID=2940544 RepID=UPI0024759EED|nr:LD-carboxypeptidase [Streptomyces sp. SAI-144]MDH6435687.1 muramoyltetrapeptide carboxypeptidase [Streptomyces sp. SAI-144]
MNERVAASNPAEPVRPRRLAPGDLVAVCTPSGPGAPLAPRRFERGLQYLRDQGFRLRVGSQAWEEGYAAGSARARAAEINDMIRDSDVRAVVCAIGGYTTNGILPHLDWKALADDPKVIVGYSDITALLLAAFARTGVITFHGPTLMPEFAEYPSALVYTEEAFRAATGSARAVGRLRPPAAWTEEFLLWDERDGEPRRTRPHDGWQWLVGGTATGRLLGGNLDTVCALTGTGDLPDFTGAVFFWETCSQSIGEIERNLTHLACAGVTDGIAAMIVGRSFRAGDAFEAQLRAYVSERWSGAPFPVLAGVDLGHSDPMLTLPVGARCRLDSGTDVFEVIEAAVQ